jgi:ParB-like chromosome segregation protein Spo0J
MPEERLEALARNIRRQGGRYPPLVTRPHPEIPDHFELLDGVHRAGVLRQLGHSEAICLVWPCDDAEALVLLATLNRLEGEDVPARRAELLAELSTLLPAEELAQLLPEDGAQISDTLELLDLDVDRLLAELERAAQSARDAGPRLMSFAVEAEDEAVIEEAIAAAMAGLEGRNRRGRALATLARRYLRGDGDA